MIEGFRQLMKFCGEEILEIYGNFDSLHYESKKDNSPLTEADTRSNNIICAYLQENFPGIPVISEENKEIAYDVRKGYSKFWLVDPLDGTKEFLKKNGEFTVNIALVNNQKPEIGIVYAPVLNKFYYAEKGKGAYLQQQNGFHQIKVNKKTEDIEKLKIVCSRSHMCEFTQEFINKYNKPEQISIGSSLKFLLVAEGNADIYPRKGPTMEWDTAAAQIIVEEAGGRVLEWDSETALTYNKSSLLNPGFVVYGTSI